MSRSQFSIACRSAARRGSLAAFRPNAHVTPAHAVGTALAFSVAVKILVVPMQMYRKQVDYRVLGYMHTGGVRFVLSVLLITLGIQLCWSGVRQL